MEVSVNFFLFPVFYDKVREKRGVTLTSYKAKRSNLKTILSKNNTKLDALAVNTGIPKSTLDDYLSKKVISLNNSMTISKELNCKIEDLYEWNVTKG
jgi:DNA-binding Xre family transcriptional regulator